LINSQWSITYAVVPLGKSLSLLILCRRLLDVISMPAKSKFMLGRVNQKVE
jgi:hypothetical protein